jgi:hypothetical protein
MKSMSMVPKIKSMEIGGSPVALADDGERARFLAIARTLRQAGAIDFKVHTSRKKDGGYSAVAVPH